MGKSVAVGKNKPLIGLFEDSGVDRTAAYGVGCSDMRQVLVQLFVRRGPLS